MLEATSVLYHVPLTDQFAEMLQQLIVIFYATNVPLTPIGQIIYDLEVGNWGGMEGREEG